MSSPSTLEKKTFQAEVKELLGLMIHSLYSHREIFLRELISNASDALDKLRIEALARPELYEGDEALRLRLEVDPAGRRLRVIDNGIGMSRQELVDNLGTIASSGTRRFLEAARERAGEAQLSGLIGRFGVGFYASFMVAGEISVETRRAGEAHGTRWRSRGDGEYTLEDIGPQPRGTVVELALHPPSGDDDGQDFADAHVLRELVRRYSDFIEWPIEIPAAQLEDGHDLKRETSADGVDVYVLNSRKPLWARPREQVTREEYAQLYKHLAHGFDEPLETIHFRTEGGNEYTALLFLPSERPPELFDPRADHAPIQLYVRRVFITADCKELLPPWLRFVRGVVDSQDLPLNVSREMLQDSRQIRQIRERLVKKVLETLERMCAERREDYRRFWAAFGPILKEGIVLAPEHAEAVARVALFETTRGEEPTTLDEYVARMAEGQEAIHCLSAPDRESALRSPHLERVRARGLEALLLVDAVDEWVLTRLREWKAKPLQALERGQADLDSPEGKEEREQQERELRPLLETLEGELAGQVERVRFSSRLVESPAVLVDEESSVGPQMERMLRQTGREAPKRRRVLELNPGHPVVARMQALHAGDPRSPRIAQFAQLLHGQALLAEGSPLPDPARFGKLVNELMLAAAP